MSLLPDELPWSYPADPFPAYHAARLRNLQHHPVSHRRGWIGSKSRILSLANSRLVEPSRAASIDQARYFLHAHRIPNYNVVISSGSILGPAKCDHAHQISIFLSVYMVWEREGEKEKARKRIEIESVAYPRWALFHVACFM
jgi:hypothetical protein